MFTWIDMFVAVGITFFLTSFVFLFMAGASLQEREGEAYKEGYYRGFSDGKKVGGDNATN